MIVENSLFDPPHNPVSNCENNALGSHLLGEIHSLNLEIERSGLLGGEIDVLVWCLLMKCADFIANTLIIAENHDLYVILCQNLVILQEKTVE